MSMNGKPCLIPLMTCGNFYVVCNKICSLQSNSKISNLLPYSVVVQPVILSATLKTGFLMLQLIMKVGFKGDLSCKVRLHDVLHDVLFDLHYRS